MACMCLSGCLDSDFLYGKDCDDEGKCLQGYLCDPASGRCLRPEDLVDGGPLDSDQQDGGDQPDGETGSEADPLPDAGDDNHDCLCPDCQGNNFICVYGPSDSQSSGPPGTTITVRLDRPGYDPDQLVCYTQNSRLIAPGILFSNDFEVDFEGFSTVTQAERRSRAQSVLAQGSFGARLCYNGATLQTRPIDTTGRTRIGLKYAAVADLLEDTDTFEFMVTEYSPDDGVSWFVLDIQGDGLRDADWQWFNHILPESCENLAALRIRFHIVGSDYPDDCVYLDDVRVLDLPGSTVSWNLMSNHFELSEGNRPTEGCLADEILLFGDQIPDARVCLLPEAQNPESADGQNQLGVRLNGRNSSFRNDTIDTNYVPAGSDLVTEFYLNDINLPPEGYANAWYRYRNVWLRMGGVGADTKQEPGQRFRFIWDRAAIGLDRVQLSFWIPDTADGVDDSQGVAIDDFDITWYRASHDLTGPFSDQGDGRYLATLQSDLPGQAQLTCIFYGRDPPLITDGTGINSGSYSIDFD